MWVRSRSRRPRLRQHRMSAHLSQAVWLRHPRVRRRSARRRNLRKPARRRRQPIPKPGTATGQQRGETGAETWCRGCGTGCGAPPDPGVSGFPSIYLWIAVGSNDFPLAFFALEATRLSAHSAARARFLIRVAANPEAVVAAVVLLSPALHTAS